jgi:hypothetical protein
MLVCDCLQLTAHACTILNHATCSSGICCDYTNRHVCSAAVLWHLSCRLASGRPSATAAAAAAAAAPASDDAAMLSFQWMGKIVERLVALYSHAPWQVSCLGLARACAVRVRVYVWVGVFGAPVLSLSNHGPFNA